MYQSAIYSFYKENLAALTPQKQFHFVSRINLVMPDNWSAKKLRSFEKSFLLGTDVDIKSHLERIGQTSIDTTHLNAATERMPFFYSIPWLFGYELQLFQVLHARIQYKTDISQYLADLFQPNFDEICNLAFDAATLATLSTYLVDVFYLQARLISQDEEALLSLNVIDQALSYSSVKIKNPVLAIYLLTHCIIGETLFYAREIPDQKLEYYRKLSNKLQIIAEKDWYTLTIDSKLEIALCLLLSGTPSILIQRAIDDAEKCYDKSVGFIVDSKVPHKNTLSWAEHRNVLYLMVISKTIQKSS